MWDIYVKYLVFEKRWSYFESDNYTIKFNENQIFK
jgi:hypothetical protein